MDQVLDEDLRRNVSEDIVVLLINRGTFRGYDGVKQLAQMLSEELPAEQGAFDKHQRGRQGLMGLLERTYNDSTVRVRDGVESHLIEDGKIVAQTIHYTLEKPERLDLSGGPSSEIRPPAQLPLIGMSGRLGCDQALNDAESLASDDLAGADRWLPQNLSEG